jgi:hypothetical protein
VSGGSHGYLYQRRISEDWGNFWFLKKAELDLRNEGFENLADRTAGIIELIANVDRNLD